MSLRSILAFALLGLLSLSLYPAATLYAADSGSVNPTLRHSNCTSSMASVTPEQLAAGVENYQPPIRCSAPRLQLAFFGIGRGGAVNQTPLVQQASYGQDYMGGGPFIYYFRSPVYSDGTVLIRNGHIESQMVELDFAQPDAVGAQLKWMSQTGLIKDLQPDDISNITAWLSNASLDTAPGDCFTGSLSNCLVPNTYNSSLMWVSYTPASRMDSYNTSPDALFGQLEDYPRLWPQPGRLMALWGLQPPNLASPAAGPALPPLAAAGDSNQAMIGNGSQPGTPPNVVVTSPLPAPAQPPVNAPDGQPPAPAITETSTPPASPPSQSEDSTPPASPPAQPPAPSPSTSPPAAYTYDKSAQQLGASPPTPFAAQSSSNTWPWWMAPAIVAALGAFFMGVMAFYYRQPSVLGPFQTPGAPAPEAEAAPVYLSTTRIALMEQMADTERIPTDIALRLKKSKSTVVEQLEDLCSSGLVERISTPGKKFVFYRLSRSGRHALVHSPDAKKKPSLLPF